MSTTATPERDRRPRGESPPPLTDAQARLVEANLGLARKWAAILLRRGGAYARCDLDELTSAAFEGLCDAAPRFDPSRGLAFFTFAQFYCVARCQDAAAGAGPITLPRAFVKGQASGRTRALAARAMRPARIGHAPRSADDSPALDVPGRADRGGDAADDREAADAALRDLDPRSRRLLELRHAEGMTREDVGRELGVSGERVRQLEARAIRKVRGEPEDTSTTRAEDATLAAAWLMAARDGRPPTSEELHAELGGSLVAVRHRVGRLVRKGHLVKLPGCPVSNPPRPYRYAPAGCGAVPDGPERREAARVVLAAMRGPRGGDGGAE